MEITLDTKTQHIDIAAVPDNRVTKPPRITVWNQERDSLHVHFEPDQWIILARNGWTHAVNVYVFASAQAAQNFADIAGHSFESIEWLQKPT